MCLRDSLLLTICIQGVACFLLTPHKCPVSWPCICSVFDTIDCHDRTLSKTLPNFEKSNQTWILNIQSSGITRIPNGALANITITELYIDSTGSAPFTIEDGAFLEQKESLANIDIYAFHLEASSLRSLLSLDALEYLTVRTRSQMQWSDDFMTKIGKTLTHFTVTKLFENVATCQWPKSFNKLKQLTYLDLSFNPCLGGQLDNLQAYNSTLTTLLLTGNGLTTLPEALKNMPNLETLDLSENDLNDSSFHSDSFGPHSHLESLKMESNRMTFVPQGLSSLTNLKKLDLSVRSLKDVDVEKLPVSLNHLNLDHTSLTAVPGNLPFLSNLTLLTMMYSYKISTIGNTDFNNMASLQTLSLSESHVQNISPNAFKGDMALAVLYLSMAPRINLTLDFDIMRDLPQLYVINFDSAQCTCSSATARWWTTLRHDEQPTLRGRCINTNKNVLDFLETCEP